MRNLFDQYDQPENKLTHALVCTLQSDPKLIRPFLKKLLRIRGKLPTRQIQVVEQQIPGEAVSRDENESKGLPDAWFYDYSDENKRWAVLVESKVQAHISFDQLKRHAKTGERHSQDSQVVLIAVDRPKKLLPEVAHSIEWRKVYGWFNKQASHSEWARKFVDYMRVFESQMIAINYNIRGTITMFDGLHFDKKNPYTYGQGKRLIRLFRSELQKHPTLLKLGVDPDGKGRTAITGSGQESVWDVLSLKVAHRSKLTNYPHFTIDLHPEYANAAISVPNGVKGGFRSKLKESGEQGFQELILRIEKRLRPIIKQTGAQPIIHVHQRHYKTQSSPAVTDARLIANLRTLVFPSGSKVRHQPEWLNAIYEVLCHKRSNIHFKVEVRFPYGCKAIGSHKAVDLYAKAWIAMSPLLDFVLGRKG